MDEATRLQEERERRLLELAFERSASRAVIECMTDGVIVVNNDAQVALANEAADALLATDLSGREPVPIAQAFAEQEPLLGMFEALLRASNDTRQLVSREIPLPKGKTAMAKGTRLRDPARGLLGAVAVMRDITALKKLDDVKSEFVLMVSHEVRSPLSAVQGYLEALLQGAVEDDPEQRQRIYARCKARLGGLSQLMTELLDMTLIEAGPMESVREPLDLAQVAREVVASFAPKAQEKEQDLRLESPGPAMVFADRTQMTTVLSNLVDNAIKHSGPNAAVTVTVEKSGAHVIAAVRDTGMGISPDALPKVFDEFYRVRDKHTKSIIGTGLGLSLVKKIVEQHNGTVEAESEPGQGTRFTVRVPCLRRE